VPGARAASRGGVRGGAGGGGAPRAGPRRQATRTALAERYPGELALRVTVPSRYPPGARRLTLGTKVAPDPALVAGLLEYGQVVVIDR
jgi:hypothetical protein